MNFPNFQALADYLNKQAGKVVVDPNNPTYEGQQLVNNWLKVNQQSESNPDGYEVPENGNTDKYLKAQTEQPPENTPDPMQDATAQYKGRTTALTPEEQYRMQQTQAKAVAPNSTMAKVDNINPGNKTPVTDPSAQQMQDQPTQDTTATIQPVSTTETAQAVTSALSGWTPILANSLNNSIDPSGLSAGARSQAAIYDKAAADNAKILQWNKQRATDERLDDKVAAAQAAKSRKQAAETVGLEGGAAAAAEATDQAQLDVMAAENFKQGVMQDATQNLAETNKNKLNAEALKTNANVNDWKTNYNQLEDNVATNLSQAASAKKTSTEKKPEQPAENKEQEDKPDTKIEGTVSTAPSNQQSEGVQNATTQTAEQQQIDDIVTKATQIVEGFKAGEITGDGNNQYAEYDKYHKEYEALKDKVPNPPKFPEMETPESLRKAQENNETQQNIVNTISELR